jgi:hypothetical protein
MIVPTYVPEQMPSPRAQELGQRLALVISEFQQNNPDLTAEEIRAATQIATGHVTARRGAAPALLAAVLAGVVALGAILYVAPGSPAAGHAPWIVIATGAIIVAAALAIRHRGS